MVTRMRPDIDTEELIQPEEIAELVRFLVTREGKGTLENIMTTSDLAVQDFLTGRLAQLLPGSGFLREEEDVSDVDHEYVWIIDPIDGTKYLFSAKRKRFCTVMADYNFIFGQMKTF